MKIMNLTGYKVFILFFLSICTMDTINAKNPDSLYIEELLSLSYDYATTNQDSGLTLTDSCFNMSVSQNYPLLCGKALRYKSRILTIQGLLGKSLETLYQAVNIDEKEHYELGMGLDYNRIGNVYYLQKNYPMALSFFTKASGIFKKLKDYQNQAMVYNNIGGMHMALSKFDSAARVYKECMITYKNINDSMNLAMTYNNLANCYFRLYYDQNQDSSLMYYAHALAIYEQLNDLNGIAATNLGISRIYVLQKDLDKAELTIQKALQIYSGMNNMIGLRDSYGYLMDVYKEKKDFEKAFEAFEKFYELNNQVSNERVRNQITELEIKYQTEQNERKIAEQNLELFQRRHDMGVMNDIGIGLIISLVLLATLAIIIAFRYREKTNSNRIITEQKVALEYQNQHFMDSVSYAKNIQKAILPAKSYLKECLNDYFLIYRPKDIVSGDFYWVHQINGKSIVALADCTGHGVPGAFMSMLGHSLLNEIIINNGQHETNKILDQLRLKIMYALQQKEDSLLHYDGMDIALCLYDPLKQEIHFSGAFCPLYIVSANTDFYKDQTPVDSIYPGQIYPEIGLVEIKGDTQPVGKYYTHEKPFTKKIVKLQKGDMVYLYTDGYVDQIGGASNNKFMIQPFKELLISLYRDSSENQKDQISRTMEYWITEGSRKQMDDITVIGFRVSG